MERLMRRAAPEVLAAAVLLLETAGLMVVMVLAVPVMLAGLAKVLLQENLENRVVRYILAAVVL